MRIPPLALGLIIAFPVLSAAKPFHFTIDTVTFRQTDAAPAKEGEVRPGVWIDSNIVRAGGILLWGKAKSRKPYGINFSFTDPGFRFERTEFASVELIYKDGAREQALDRLNWPLSFPLRKFTAVNSTRDGIVETELNVLHAEIPAVVSKDQAFTLRIAGRFIGKDGEHEEFQFTADFEPEKTDEKVPMPEVWKQI